MQKNVFSKDLNKNNFYINILFIFKTNAMHIIHFILNE